MADLLESYLHGIPLNERLARLKEEGDEIEDENGLGDISPQPDDRTDDTDREHIRRLLADAGWQVLLELLDSEIERLEDTAKKRSLQNPFSGDLAAAWAEAAYMKRSRNRIVDLAKAEAEKLKAKKKNGSTVGH